jgi:nicotinate-nucleotide adenylyltransferase
MGADSWEDILTWREWKTVLTMTNHIVVTRPGHTIKFDHVSDAVRGRISDLRDDASLVEPSDEQRIYISDAVNMNLSATELRRQVRFGESGWHRDVPKEVAKYIQKYEIYK